MRGLVNPAPGGGTRITSSAVALTVDAWEAQPNAADVPVGTLPIVDGELRDDGSQAVARTYMLRVGAAPSWLKPGMWLRATVGVQVLQPIMYRLPVLCVTDIASTPDGATVAAADPGEIINGRPYETDVVLSGTLRQLVDAAVKLALSRTTDVSGVPATTVPSTVVDFGSPRWDVCLAAADALGIALRFTDPGDVVGVLRSAAPPAPAAVVEHVLTDAGSRHAVRTPTGARVLVSRGPSTPGLVGTAASDAITGSSPPAWYRPYIITDRQNGTATTTQAQADQLAKDLLRARLSELDVLDSMPILPAPWLEVGDVVTYAGLSYYVRAVTLALPSLATTVTLRRIP